VAIPPSTRSVHSKVLASFLVNATVRAGLAPVLRNSPRVHGTKTGNPCRRIWPRGDHVSCCLFCCGEAVLGKMPDHCSARPGRAGENETVGGHYFSTVTPNVIAQIGTLSRFGQSPPSRVAHSPGAHKAGTFNRENVQLVTLWLERRTLLGLNRPVLARNGCSRRGPSQRR